MNTLSILPQIIICFLQRANVTRKTNNIRDSTITTEKEN